MRSAAFGRYNRRAVVLSVAYGVFLLSATYAFKHHIVGGGLAILLAALPALPIIGMFVALGFYLVEETDEYLRAMMVRQILWASGFALSAATLWGFLEAFEVVGHVEAYYVAVLWFGGLGLGACMNKLTFWSAAR